MTTFDGQIEQVAQYVAAMQAQGRTVRRTVVPSALDGLGEGLPIRVGAGASPRILLRGDTFVELGSPDAGSAVLTLWTNSTALVAESRITVIGPDIPEAANGSLPFGQIVMVGGREFGSEEHSALTQAQVVADQIEGYMARGAGQTLWSRVSKDAAAKGFCFETLGRALMMLIRTSVPKTQTIEIVFVTSGKSDVKQLNEIAEPAQAMGREIVKEHWKAKGFDLDCDLDCSSCHDQAVCDDIRDVLGARKKVLAAGGRGRGERPGAA